MSVRKLFSVDARLRGGEESGRIFFKGNKVFIFAAPKFGISQIEALSTTLISCCVVMLMDCTSLTR